MDLSKENLIKKIKKLVDESNQDKYSWTHGICFDDIKITGSKHLRLDEDLDDEETIFFFTGLIVKKGHEKFHGSKVYGKCKLIIFKNRDWVHLHCGSTGELSTNKQQFFH